MSAQLHKGRLNANRWSPSTNPGTAPWIRSGEPQSIPVNQCTRSNSLVGHSWNWRSSLLDIPLLMRSFGVANWEIVVIEGLLRQVLSSPLIYLELRLRSAFKFPPGAIAGASSWVPTSCPFSKTFDGIDWSPCFCSASSVETRNSEAVSHP